MAALRRWLIMIVLSVSGGIIFLLPFLQEIYFIPIADALQLNNTEVGSLMSVFGVTAMLSYLPGGWLADRASPRKLITFSLISTGAAGMYFATFPGYLVSLAIHGLWGVTITFLFWGSMIRVTRGWAPANEQGKAFGILESGRGIAEALVASALVVFFGVLGSDDMALSTVITIMSVMTAALGVVAWFVIEDQSRRQSEEDSEAVPGVADVVAVLRMPVVWLIAISILTAYSAYWATFRFTTYATEILAFSVGIGAAVGAAKNFLKPAAALVAGFVSDRLGIARSVSFLFAVLVVGFLLFAMIPGRPEITLLMLLIGIVITLAAFALRGIYFALLEEGGIPMAVTGTAAGVVSTIGYTPDIFMPLLGGALLDAYPGEDGYRYFFLATTLICAVGLVASLIIYYRFAARK